MKQDLKADSPPNRSTAWLALIALLALGFSAAAYLEVHRDMTAGDKDEAMLVQINEVAHLHVMLGEIGNGHVDEVRKQMKATLADDLAAVQLVVADSDTQAGRYSQTVLDWMNRCEKAHPDYYLASTAPAAVPAGQSGSQMAASRVTTH